MSEELLTTKDVAHLAGVTPRSMSVYVAMSAAARRRGADVKPGAKNAVPAEDYRFGQSPVWKRSTVEPWLQAREASNADV